MVPEVVTLFTAPLFTPANVPIFPPPVIEALLKFKLLTDPFEAITENIPRKL